jgi:RimJ/RimL family protein N-acetyltransferase
MWRRHLGSGTVYALSGPDGMTIRLDALTAEDCEQVRVWRNSEARPSLRTQFMLTAEMQADFYRTVVCNRQSPHRYWAVLEEEPRMPPVRGTFRGMVGLTNISFENGSAEISLIMDPTQKGGGIGRRVVTLILTEAFRHMRLLTVVGECYRNNPALGFWQKMVEEFRGTALQLPARKYWDGKLWDALYFTFTAEAFQA